MLSSCPICGRGPLQPVLADKTLYAVEENGRRSLEKFQAYSCGSPGHILIIAANGTGLKNGDGKQRASEFSVKGPVLNSWKELSAYLGRGVRTLQRWEQELGLPVHRPRAKSRGPVMAVPEELDAWLRQRPVHDGAATTNGNGATGNGKVGNGNGAAHGQQEVKDPSIISADKNTPPAVFKQGRGIQNHLKMG